MFDAHAYTIRTRRVADESGEVMFKASVAELPHLATYESSAQEAYDVLIEDIEALHTSATALGHSFPEPQAEADSIHSGRITLRLPKSLHRKLDEQAKVENVSLNLHIVTLLSEESAARASSEKTEKRIQVTIREALSRAERSSARGFPLGDDISIGYSNTKHYPMAEIESKEKSWTARH